MSNTSKPLLIMDQHFRQVEELFSPESFAKLAVAFEIIGGLNWPMEREVFLNNLPNADVVVAAKPMLTAAELAGAHQLKAIIEVSGTFQDGIDYGYCFENQIDVLSCSPGFRYSVAEMTLGLMLAGCRGIVEEHERFRDNRERWLRDNIGNEFMLYGQSIGFVGYGEIARELTRLLAPFAPQIKAFDPWLKASGTAPDDIQFCALDEVMSTCRVVVIAATPTDENYQLISRKLIARLPKGALVVLASRAHLVDFDALLEAAETDHIRFASDVFPVEPVARTSRYRSARNVIWSPHRAAAVEGGRHPIGDMIVQDCANIMAGTPDRALKPADASTVDKIIRAPRVAR
ncbi:MAG: NAD(P)-dependent oxidoreductase [Paracoccaceae bacterium]|nr:NAD(P)-dependent oxidoreductase [Paracoccaceae bacterium]